MGEIQAREELLTRERRKHVLVPKRRGDKSSFMGSTGWGRERGIAHRGRPVGAGFSGYHGEKYIQCVVRHGGEERVCSKHHREW